MNKYKKMVSECFTAMSDNDIDAAFSFARDSEKRFPMCSDFRDKIEQYFKDKGYSKKQIMDIMEMYTAAYSVGFSTGAVMYSFACDVEKTNTLFDL